MAARTSESLPAPVSNTATPAVACGTKIDTSPSRLAEQNPATSAVMSNTPAVPPVSILNSTLSMDPVFQTGDPSGSAIWTESGS